MNEISELSWNETSFRAKLRLIKASRQREAEKIKSEDPALKAEGHSALSSTYYSVCSTAMAQLKSIRNSSLFIFRALSFAFTWAPLVVWCTFRMIANSNRVVELLGYEGMTADQCDVRQSILRKVQLYGEAERCIEIALTKSPMPDHTCGLLQVGLAELYMQQGKKRKAHELVHSASRFAYGAEQYDPRQAARILRHCANILEQLDLPDTSGALRRQAEKLIATVNAKDQSLKLQ